MSEKKYQVFISSTYTDLKEERKRILDVLLMADCIPAGMEAFVASDFEQFEVIKKVIDLCDYYILIIGKRYGSVHPETNLSYTEMEYNYAIEQNIPVLVFVIDDSVDLPEDKCETDVDKQEKLRLFKANALTNRLVSTWKTIDELTGQVAIAIMKAKNEIVRTGWQRGTDFDEASLRREIMELQNENEKIQHNLDEALVELGSQEDTNNLDFEDAIFKIHYSVENYGTNERACNSTDISLKKLFIIIATEMLNRPVSEKTLAEAIVSQIFPFGFDTEYDLIDNQIVKKVLIQLHALGYIKLSKEKLSSTPYWELTKKGERIRNDIVLLKKHSNTN